MGRRLLSLAVSGGILALLYWRIDARALLEVLAGCHPGWLAAAVALLPAVVPLAAVRLEWLLPPGSRLGFAEANRLILVAWVLNVILPSKGGDFAKALLFRQRVEIRGGAAFSVVVLEKAFELLGLLTVCGTALLWLPDKPPWLAALTGGVGLAVVVGASFVLQPAWLRLAVSGVRPLLPAAAAAPLAALEEAWSGAVEALRRDPARLARVAGVSVALSATGLLQAWLLVFALRAALPAPAAFGLLPLGILAGFLPLTFGGVGTRDAALVLLLRPFLAPPQAAGLGVLMTLRYLLLAALGLPLLGRYLPALRPQEKGRSKENN